MIKPVIILGSGGHAKVLIEALRLNNVKIIGLTDPEKKKGSKVFELDVIGNDDSINEYPASEVNLINGIGSIPGMEHRWRLADTWSKKGYIFPNIIHPSAIVSHDTKFDSGVQIMAGVVIQPGVYIGNHTIINTRASIDHDCIIGNYCHVAPGVTLSGSVKISNNVHVGTGANIIQGMTVGSNCTIAAGSTIYKDIPANSKIIGNI